MFMILHADEAERFEEQIAPIVANRQAYAMLEVTFVGKGGRDASWKPAPLRCSISTASTAVTVASPAISPSASGPSALLEQRDALVHAAYAIAGKLVTASSLDDAIEQALRLRSVRSFRWIASSFWKMRRRGTGLCCAIFGRHPGSRSKSIRLTSRALRLRLRTCWLGSGPLSMGHVAWADLHAPHLRRQSYA